ncbi:MAG: ATP-binding cassette domain-containing protein [Gemmatimonadota bacterium]|jgi:phospholipid/cholesterol/gamma-HCH transport system ATP-binding protein|nr:ATP-binding cassette domain-containing protein [Gemmatimonadota bacterium]
MLEYIGVRKAFDAPVLTDVNLRIETGETMSIVGHSGTGKSVLLKTTIGLIIPDRGDVRIDGASVFHSDRRTIERIRRKAGYVFQNAALFDSMSIYENVAQGIPEDQLRRMSRRETVVRVGDALEMVNLDPRAVLAKLPAELSGGMRKRVGLARAIIGRPEIILYDEPVTGLDPVNATIVHQLIERLGDELGVTSVLVTHDVEGALPISDRVAMLDGGKFRFVGTPAEFKTSDDQLVRAFLERHAPTGPDRVLEAL